MAGTARWTFYAHLSGRGSYTIVAAELRRALERAGMLKRAVDLRALARDAIPLDGSPALLFGFPGWWNDIEHATRSAPHAVRVGFHVGDVLPVPEEWADVINRLDACFVPSTWAEAVLLAAGVRVPLYLAPHGVPDDMPCTCQDWHTRRAEPVFLHFCSSHDPARKGTLQLIDAFSRMSCGRLVIYTASSAVKTVAQACTRASAITIVEEEPVESQAAQRSRFDAADFLVQPSRAEGFGILPMDGLAMGLPVIATTCTGHAMTLSPSGPSGPTPGLVPVRHGGLAPCTGGLAPSLSSDDVEDALREAIARWPALRAAALNARARFIEAHAWDRVLAQFLYYARLVVS